LRPSITGYSSFYTIGERQASLRISTHSLLFFAHSSTLISKWEYWEYWEYGF
jgi:hypothetical protein